MTHTDDSEYTPLFKKQILEIVSTRKVIPGGWWDYSKRCGCPLTELACANGFKPPTNRLAIRGKAVLDFNQHNLGHSFNMQSAFIEAFDTAPHALTAYEICERIFAP